MPLFPSSSISTATIADALGYRTSGSETMSRLISGLGSGVTMSSGTVRFAYLTALRTETITQISVATAGTAAGATPTLIRFGLYSVAANGDLAQLAVTPNDTALLAATTTAYAKATSASANVVAGVRYAIAGLVVTGATAPTLGGVPVASSADAGAALKLGGLFSGQTDLLSSYTAAQVTTSTNVIYASVRP